MAASSGKLLAAGMLGLGLVAAALSISYRREQTRRALTLWGPEQAVAIATAPVVKVLWFEPPLADAAVGDVAGRASRRSSNVNGTPGFATVRQLLVDDTSFDWQSESAAEPTGWTFGLEFSDPPAAEVLVLLDPTTRRVRGAKNRKTVRLNSGAAEQLKRFFEGQFAGQDKQAPAE
ncbi:MAG TPA: hypothetical protein VGG30_04225 [Pirellulales bacterium]|jgi:hypothetical protein